MEIDAKISTWMTPRVILNVLLMSYKTGYYASEGMAFEDIHHPFSNRSVIFRIRSSNCSLLSFSRKRSAIAIPKHPGA